MASSDFAGRSTEPGLQSESSDTPALDDSFAEPLKAARVCDNWVSRLQSEIDSKNISGIVELFAEDGWWKDMLTIDFDFNTLKKGEIQQYLARFGIPGIKNLKIIRPADAMFVPVGTITWAQAYITYETNKFRGKGLVRLKEEEGKFSRAFVFFTSLWEVKGHEEFAYERRPLGAEIHNGGTNAKNWKDLRNETLSFEKSDPTVLVIGAGHCGLMIAARLGALGIPTLVLDKNAAVGDNWAKRYHNLVLHDPVWADHFPYIQYPPHWPIFTPKDKLARWFQSYADAMELNIWMRSTIQGGASYDKVTGKWTITVVRDGHQPRSMKVNHIVQATGFSGEPRVPTFPGIKDFRGTICHSSYHVGAKGWGGKKAIVVGSSNSGHDIAADFYEQGADTTMVQRSSTYVASSEHGMPIWFGGFYQEGGPPLEDADMMLISLPVPFVEQIQISSTKIIEELDKDMLKGLEKAGFKHNRYKGGLFMKYFRDGGGYYIDVGCSKLIGDGKIRIKQGQDITKITPDGIQFADGDFKEADIIVLATGYGSMRDATRRIMGPEIGEAVHTCWGLDKQGEMQTCWRNTGVPGFWLQCGNFFQSRCFSRVLALQIQMIELGLADKNHPYPVEKENKDSRF